MIGRPGAGLLFAGLTLSVSACEPGASRASREPGASPAPPPPTTASDPPRSILEDPIVGTVPTEWSAERWLNAEKPVTLASLRGRVVLVRWFMGTSCPFCSATAPALRSFHAAYEARGLSVIGLYHHKGDAPLAPGEYEAYVKDYGFTFPVGLDPEWRTLKRWWLDGHPRKWTSVSFLIGRDGRVRGVHQGGRYGPGDPDHAAVRAAIEALLDEPAP